MNEGDAQALAAQVLAALERGRVPTNPDEAARWGAIESAANRLIQLVDRIPWATIPPAWLEGVQGAFDPVVASVEAYVDANDEAAPFSVTWPEVERLWSSLTPFVATSIPEESVAEDAATFRRSVGQMLRRLTAEVEAAEKDVAAVRGSLDALTSQRDEAISQIRERQEALEATINEQSTRLDQAIRDNQTQFSEAQERHRTEFATALEGHEVTLKAQIEDADERTSVVVAAAQDQATDALGRIEELERKATKSYNTIGTSSVAGYYQKDADDEQRQARLWRWLAVAAFVLIAVGTIIELAVSGGSLGWEQTRSRIPVVLGLAGFAAFAVAEARTHRKAERESRDREVKLSSIDPYLVLVSDQVAADKLKQDYAQALFLAPSDSQPVSDGTESSVVA